MNARKIHFITGRLAEHSLREVLVSTSADVGFSYTIDVLPITVAALMTPQWIARHIRVPQESELVILPGYCRGDLTPLTEHHDIPFQVGPKELRRLPQFFGQKKRDDDFGKYDIEILGEINHAPSMSRDEIVQQANCLRESGANLIDVGCIPGQPSLEIGDIVRQLKDEGHRISIDSFDAREVSEAVKAGAELVLSVNSSNAQQATQWGCEVVVIPDEFDTLKNLDETLTLLSDQQVPVRIDPILEPIGCGFAKSLARYMEVRHRYPDAEIMMGIGNLTELTDVDSAGVNVLLLGICQELGIRSVLTTQVINWAKTSVKECDLARRLVYYAVHHKTPPKRLDPNLVTLRDSTVDESGFQTLEKLAAEIKDRNFRIFSGQGSVHVVGAGLHLSDQDPFEVFDQLIDQEGIEIDASHAFYLGFEMCKAATAAQLGKEYTQDEALDWGYLTQPETDRHRLKKSTARRRAERDQR